MVVITTGCPARLVPFSKIKYGQYFTFVTAVSENTCIYKKSSISNIAIAINGNNLYCQYVEEDVLVYPLKSVEVECNVQVQASPFEE